jgi:hypothetical protein
LPTFFLCAENISVTTASISCLRSNEEGGLHGLGLGQQKISLTLVAPSVDEKATIWKMMNEIFIEEDSMNTKEIINKIDWQLLNKQRLILADLSMSPVVTNEQQEALDGIVNLLDDLCDAEGVS